MRRPHVQGERRLPAWLYVTDGGWQPFMQIMDWHERLVQVGTMQTFPEECARVMGTMQNYTVTKIPNMMNFRAAYGACGQDTAASDRAVAIQDRMTKLKMMVSEPAPTHAGMQG